MASTANADSVRRLIYGGSTRSGSLSAADVDSFVDENANVWLAASAAADAEALKALAGGKKKVGDLEIDVGATAQGWLALAKRLRVQGIRKGGAKPYGGGISLNDKASNESDSDWAATAGKLGQFDYRGDGSVSTGAF